MAKYNGRAFLLQHETATPDTYATVGALQSTGLTINNESVDVSNKSDGRQRQMINAGINSMSISGAGILTDDSVAELVEGLARSGVTENFRIISARADSYTGPFQVTSFERTGEHNGAEQFSISLESAVDITYAAS